MNAQQSMRIPLGLITIGFGIGFFDGLIGLGLPQVVYGIAGLAMMAGLVWAWVVVLRKPTVTAPSGTEVQSNTTPS